MWWGRVRNQAWLKGAAKKSGPRTLLGVNQALNRKAKVNFLVGYFSQKVISIFCLKGSHFSVEFFRSVNVKIN